MNNLKRTWSSDYTVVSNTLINCFGLNPMTRFLCIYLSAQANNFQFTNATLCAALDCSEDTLRKYVKDAIKHGLIERERITVKGKFGYFSYTLIDPTTLENLPHGKKTKLEKNQSGKSTRLNKEEVLTKVSTNNKEEAPASAAPAHSEDSGKSEASETVQPSAPKVRTAAHPETGFDPFGEAPAPTFQGGTEDDYKVIYGKIAKHLNRGGGQWKDIAAIAKCQMSGEQFKDELQTWVRFYMNKPHLYKNPVQSLRGGPISFVNWLRKPWAQEKYNPYVKAQKKQTQTSGPVRRTISAA